jgi:hypothetical protein
MFVQIGPDYWSLIIAGPLGFSLRSSASLCDALVTTKMSLTFDLEKAQSDAEGRELRREMSTDSCIILFLQNDQLP